jgi:hypothetical protein
MPAGYSTGVASSPVNLLQTLVTWLVTQGFTQEHSASEGGGWAAALSMGGIYAVFRAAMNEEIWPKAAGGSHDSGTGGYGIGFYLADGWDGGESWFEQSGRPVRSPEGSTCGVGMNLPSGAIAGYHFFHDGDGNVVVVVEREPGVFAHLGWGPDLPGGGNPEAFPYFFGSSPAYMNTDPDPLNDRAGVTITAYPPMCQGDRDKGSLGEVTTDVHASGYVRVDAVSFAPRWVGNCEEDNDGYGWTGRFLRCALTLGEAVGQLEADEYPDYQYWGSRVHQAAYVGSTLLPLHLFLETAAARWAPIGYLPTVFWCEAVGHGYAKGQVYQVGGQDYMVFPRFAVRKDA